MLFPWGDFLFGEYKFYVYGVFIIILCILLYLQASQKQNDKKKISNL
jgi:hypothetical protein